MYYHPFYLLTEDAERNRAIADVLANEQKRHIASKTALYNSFPDSQQNKVFYDLLELEKALTSTVCDVLRADYSVLTTTLPRIDHWRVSEKAKKVLAIMRAIAGGWSHKFQDAAFLRILQEPDKWGDAEASSISLAAWNHLVLARVSDVHRDVSRLVDNVYLTVHAGEDAETLASIVKFLEAWRTVAREVKEYCRLVASL